MGQVLGKRAVVVGGSIAGLLAARVASSHFEEVVVVERDPVRDEPEARKGQPHARHLHALLASGYQRLQAWFPGIGTDLVAGGALIGDVGRLSRWYQFGGWKVAHDSGIEGCAASRAFMEWVVRARVLALPNVRLLDEHEVTSLAASADRAQVVGARVRGRAGQREELLPAELVVDASGRGGSTSRRLEALGYERPSESRVTVRIAYATRTYRRDPEARIEAPCVVLPLCAPERHGAVLFPVEGDRWLVSAAGIHGVEPPLDDAGFSAFLRDLDVPDIFDIVSRCEPLSDVVPHKFPFSVRRHYEKLRRFPAGLLVLGDGLASFNPVLGQGMSVAALEAGAIEELLGARGLPPDLWREYFHRAARVVDVPWQIAVAEDFRWAQTRGSKALGTDLLNAYTLRLHHAMEHDVEAYRQFLRVAHLVDPPLRLFRPRLVWSALRAHRPAVAQPRAERAEPPLHA